MVGDGARGGGTKGVYFRGGFKFSLKKLVFVVVVVFFWGGAESVVQIGKVTLTCKSFFHHLFFWLI